MLDSILRIIRVAAVVTILVALSGHEAVRSAVAVEETDAARCENAELTWCMGALYYENARCTVGATGCATCVVGTFVCGSRGGYRPFAE